MLHHLGNLTAFELALLRSSSLVSPAQGAGREEWTWQGVCRGASVCVCVYHTYFTTLS